MNSQIDMMDAGVMDRPVQPVTPPRPGQTPELIAEAARAFVRDVLPDHPPESADDIAKCWRAYMDGYELSKALEIWHGWMIDEGMVSNMGDFADYVRRAVKAAEREWAKAFNVQPPHPIGTIVRCPSRERSGIIDVVCPHSPASYLVKPCEPTDKEIEFHSRWVIRFEDAELVEACA